ncbi:MAG: response regulator [Flavisolibacter sp.]
MVLDNKQTLQSVILAEDDPDDQDFFKEALSEISSLIQLTGVKNGDELMTLLESFIPDIIFLDLDMPYKNGLECITEIRANPQLQNIPIVIFSSTTRPSNINTAYEMGADLFFIKPSVYKELVSSIRAILYLDWGHPSSIKEQYCVNGRYVAFM